MPREVRGLEDYLTSRTFGLLRFLAPSTLAKLLQHAGIELPAEPESFSIRLWPTLETTEVRCEPDVALLGTRAALLFEAKYIGSRMGEYLSQLGREWLTGRALAQQRDWRGPWLALVGLTQTLRVPEIDLASSGESLKTTGRLVAVEEQIKQYAIWLRSRGSDICIPSVEDIGRSVLHCPWPKLATACRTVRNGGHYLHAGERRLLEEVIGVLTRLGLTPFAGWRLEPLPQELALPTGMWSASRSGERQVWPRLPSWPDLLSYRLLEPRLWLMQRLQLEQDAPVLLSESH